MLIWAKTTPSVPIISCAWEQRKLGEFTTSYSGGTPNVNNKEFYNGNIPFIRSAEIHKAVTELFLSKEGIHNSSAKLVKRGDILYALYGATSGAVGISRIDGAINQAILCIRANSSSSNGFLSHWLDLQKDKIVGKYLQGGQGNLSGSIIKKLVVLKPSYKEQIAVTELLDNIDNLIAANQSKLDQFKELKKLLMEKIFSQQWRFKGFTDPWEQRKFGEVIVLVGGGTPAKNNFKYWNGDISWLSSQEIKSKYIGSSTYYITKEGLDNSSARLISPGRLLIVVRSGILARRFPISISTEYVAINQDIKALIFDEKKIVLDFMFSQLQYLEPFILRSIVKSGTTVQSVNLPDFKKMIIEIPLISEQKTIGQLFKIFDDLIAANQRRLDQLKALKKYLMQNMFV